MYQDEFSEFNNFNNLNDEDNSNIYNNHFYGYQSSNECSNDIKVLFSL
jgi:hypothetical protein